MALGASRLACPLTPVPAALPRPGRRAPLEDGPGCLDVPVGDEALLALARHGDPGLAGSNQASPDPSLTGHAGSGLHLDLLAHIAAKLLGRPQTPLQAGARHLEHVAARERVGSIESSRD